MGARKVVRVTVQNLSFELDRTQRVKLVEDPAMRFQLQVEIKERSKEEFVVEVTVGTDERLDRTEWIIQRFPPRLSHRVGVP